MREKTKCAETVTAVSPFDHALPGIFGLMWGYKHPSAADSKLNLYNFYFRLGVPPVALSDWPATFRVVRVCLGIIAYSRFTAIFKLEVCVAPPPAHRGGS